MAAPPVSRTLHAGEWKAFSLCKLKPLQKFTLQHAVIPGNISGGNFTPHSWARCMHNFISVYGQRHLSGLATSILNALCITFPQPFCSEWIISLLLKLDAVIKTPLQLPLTSFFWDKIGTIWHYAIYWNVQMVISLFFTMLVISQWTQLGTSPFTQTQFFWSFSYPFKHNDIFNWSS